MAIRSISATFRLHVSLNDVEPPIWRRVLVRSDETLSGLHEILQLVIGWTNSHLYTFEADGTSYSQVNREWEVEDAAKVAVHALLRREGDTIEYLYDMGDAWRHTIRLETVIRDDDPRVLPYCEAGERACPPEDAGGAHRFMEMLAALPDPKHPDHDDWREWIGEFDANAFPIGLINRLLVRYAERSRWRHDPAALDESMRRASSVDASVQPPHAELHVTNGRHDDDDDVEYGEDDIEYDPSDSLETIVEVMEDVLARDPSFDRAVLSRAFELLVVYDAQNPDVLDRARKPATWAAGALHAAVLTLPDYEGYTLPVDMLAGVFGVSPASVQQKSLALRKEIDRHIPGEP